MDEQANEPKQANCCQEIKTKKEPRGFLSGLIYGLLPHMGCIAFIIFTILGITTATAFFKPLLLNRYFFYLLIALSFVFATISAVIYLKKCGLFSLDGMKKKWKYLFILYGTSIGVNLLLFMVIFPITSNVAAATPTGEVIASDLSEITLKVDIPCPGHAPLISEELKKIDGVQSIKFRFPNYFDIKYQAAKTSQKEILSLGVFETYKATKVSGGEESQETPAPSGCNVCGGCNCACGGTCGGKY